MDRVIETHNGPLQYKNEKGCPTYMLVESALLNFSSYVEKEHFWLHISLSGADYFRAQREGVESIIVSKDCERNSGFVLPLKYRFFPTQPFIDLHFSIKRLPSADS